MIPGAILSRFAHESKPNRCASLSPTRAENETRKRLIRESWEWFFGRKLHEDDDPEPHADMEGPDRVSP